ncbi:MAG: diguanylate cyclase domain-containing protein [Solirubrobacteraceae bacterium]
MSNTNEGWPRGIAWLVATLGAAALYVGAARLGFALAYVHATVPSIWVPSGLALAFVFLGGRRLWPAILIGACAADLLHGASATTAGLMAVGSTLQALAGQTLLRRAGFRPQLDRALDVGALLVLAGFGSTLIGGAFGAAAGLHLGAVNWPRMWNTFHGWWLGDASGVIIVTPLIFAFVTRPPRLPRWRELLEVAGFALVLSPVVLLNFGVPPELGFVALPALVWGTLRFGGRGAAVANAVVAVAVVVYAHHLGAVVQGIDLPDTLVLVQGLLVVYATTTLVLAISTTARERGAAALRASEQAARRLVEEMSALTELAGAAAEDRPTGDLLGLATRSAAQLLDLSELLVVRDAGEHHELVVAGWSRDGQGYAPGVPAPPGGIRVPVRVHGVKWGSLMMPESGRSNTEVRDPNLIPTLTRFARQLGQGIAGAETHERLTQRASTDPLTGLVNHRGFHERLAEEFARSRRHERPLSVAMLDIDGFKVINDTIGHVAGDEVLTTVARRILGVMREEVTVARLGGDELGVILPECDAATASEVIERARRAVGGTPIGSAGTVSVSAGVCDTAEAADPEQLRTFADMALYWSKARGRDRATIYSQESLGDLSDAEMESQIARSQAAVGLRALARRIDATDPAAAGHSEQVATLACALALELGWEGDRITRLREAALVHDVGKLTVSEEVLSYAGRLTPQEFEQVKRHPEIGARIAAEMLDPEQREWIRWHHERPDGTGYPDGKTASELPEGAKLLALADAWDTMVSGRLYSAPKDVREALGECMALAGTQFAPEAVEALARALESGRLDAEPGRRAPKAGA